MGNFCGCASARDGVAGVKLMARNWVKTSDTVVDNVTTSSVRILTWNVLAQQLTFNMEDGKKVSAFEKVNDEYLDWKHRAQLFEQEFFKKDPVTGKLFWDVICLQEFTCHKELFDARIN